MTRSNQGQDMTFHTYAWVPTIQCPLSARFNLISLLVSGIMQYYKIIATTQPADSLAGYHGWLTILSSREIYARILAT